MSKKVFVSPTGDGQWKAKTVGTERAAGVFERKSQAVQKATEIAKNIGGELYVQNEDGKIGYRNSYGNDPCPPRG